MRYVVWLVITLCCTCYFVQTGAAGNIPSKGDEMPRITLQMPKSGINSAYLDIENEKTLPISKIPGKILIIEIFSMYCPHCQREAPAVNRIFDAIESDPALKKNVRMIGIGAGNSEFEVNFFKKKYNIRFPLFSDRDYSIHKQVGETLTPYFFCMKKGDGPKWTLFYSHLGGIKNPKEFLSMLKNQIKN